MWGSFSRIPDIVTGRTSSTGSLVVTLVLGLGCVDARGWGPFLLGGLPLLDDFLPTAWCAQGSDLWKLETTALVVGAR